MNLKIKLPGKISKKHVAFVIALIIYSFALISIVAAVDIPTPAEPGSEGDPIVTKGYVDQETVKLTVKIDGLAANVKTLTDNLTQLTAKVTQLTGENKTLTNSSTQLTTKYNELSGKVKQLEQTLASQSKSVKFTVIELKAGQRLTAGASAEIIVRSGTATAIASKNGGLSDITSGSSKDLTTGQTIPLNHLILISRDDGRGLKAVSTKVYILFKGTYVIK